MFSTIALAATQEPIGVFFGASLGHATASVLAVFLGTVLSEYISDRTIAIISGVSFLIFASLIVYQLVS